MTIPLDYPPPDDERDPEEARYCVFCKHWPTSTKCDQCLKEDIRSRPCFEYNGRKHDNKVLDGEATK